MMRGADERAGFDVFKWLLVAVCAVLAVVVLLLARENAQLKQRLGSRPAAELAAGDRLGEVRFVTETGEVRRLELDGPALLLVFSSRCPACRAVLPIWEELYASAGPDGPSVIGLQTDAEPTDALLTFPVHRVDAERSPGMERIPYVPATVLVDADGNVRRVWFGPLDPQAVRELGELIGG
jgi:hypothetical protein